MESNSSIKIESTYERVECLISIDVGSSSSGVAIIMLSSLSCDKAEIIGFNELNTSIVDKIREYYVKYNCLVLIEDILPYGRKVSKQVLDTVKFIGELCYRLKAEVNVNFKLITRNEVRRWIFDAFNDLCIDKIVKKITYLDDYGKKKNEQLFLYGKPQKYRRYKNIDGNLRKPSFHYVDDRIVIDAMKRLWNIPEPKPYKKNIYGLKTHSWQALAVGSYYLNSSNVN